MTGEEYKCENCLEVFTKTWSDDEADEEYKQRFEVEHAEGHERATVCDDCYKAIMGDS